MTVSLIVLTFRQANTVAEAVRAAIAQDWPELDIVISDDASEDLTLDIARQAGQGTAVRYRSSEKNLGLIAHITEAVASCPSADLVVVAAGDDLSEPSRVRRLVEAWKAAGRPQSTYLYSDVTPIDFDGNLVAGWPERVARPPWTLERLADGGTGPLGASAAFTPDLLFTPGPIAPLVLHEDRVLPFRALLGGGQILYVDVQLVRYRVEGGISRDRSSSRLDELTRRTVALLQRTLPDSEQRLRDARDASASLEIIRRCERQRAFQRGQIALATGRPFYEVLAAVGAGAPLLPLLKQWLRLILARQKEPA